MNAKEKNQKILPKTFILVDDPPISQEDKLQNVQKTVKIGLINKLTKSDIEMILVQPAGTFQIEFVEHKNKKPSCTIYWSTLKKIVLNGIVTNFAQCSVCEKVIQYASTYYNRQTINENHGYKSHNAKTLKSHFMKCTRPNLNIKPDNKLDSIIDGPMIGFSRMHQFGMISSDSTVPMTNQNVSINDTKMEIEIMEDSSADVKQETQEDGFYIGGGNTDAETAIEEISLDTAQNDIPKSSLSELISKDRLKLKCPRSFASSRYTRSEITELVAESMENKVGSKVEFTKHETYNQKDRFLN